jgi:hypothetical protein
VGDEMKGCPFAGLVRAARKVNASFGNAERFEVIGEDRLDLLWELGRALAALRNAPVAIPAAVGVDAWVGMSDRKPPSGIHLFYRPAITIGGCQYGANIGTAFYYKDEEGEHYTADYHGPSSPTHWQPLPAEPLAGKVAAHE